MEAPIKKDKSPLEDSQWLSDLYRGLRSLEDHSFPKKCPKCGNVFISLTDFLCLTDKTMHSTGLLQSNDDRNSPIVGACFGTALVARCCSSSAKTAVTLQTKDNDAARPSAISSRSSKTPELMPTWPGRNS